MNTSSQYAIIFAWLLCAILFMFNTGTSRFKIHSNQKDKNALLNFKQGAIGPSGVLSSWSTKNDCCEWRGVTCDNITSRVTELNLPCSTTFYPTYVDKVDKSHCLTGSIHLSFVELKFLTYLDLSNNDFLAIQFDFVSSQNNHNGSLATPLREFVNSSVLYYLDLSINENLVIDNLQWLSHLSSLEYLDLGHIDLHKETSWLQSVTKLSSLEGLYLSHCQLEDLSPSLRYANFTSLQEWLGQIEHLQDLILEENKCSGSIPTNLGNLSSLMVFNVDRNNLTGVVSKRTFEKLSKLKILNICLPQPLIFDFDPLLVPPFQLDETCLVFGGSKPPAWLSTQRSLDSIGEIPPSMGLLSNLNALHLHENELYGEITPSLQNCPLLVFNVRENNFSGNMPNWIPKSAKALQLRSNQFSVQIPSATQLQGFSALSYIGNHYLCGPSLKKICLQDGKSKDTMAMDESAFLSWFYIGIESGFALGFLGVCCAIFLNKKWRHAYFKFLYGLRDRLCRGCNQC
ncbi:receptor-like protein EIX1 [Abrus precatorius]|uniref:Receptor-like protein EIX1 n=1 Tax=Abrus precatorius TaxID=3816 RepID=A0A8B8KIC2_ABRPR|nr:receptor-like protein EIX1 [Abrus precatorius]